MEINGVIMSAFVLVGAGLGALSVIFVAKQKLTKLIMKIQLLEERQANEAEQLRSAKEQNQQLAKDINTLQENNTLYIQEKTEAVTRLEVLREQITQLENARTQAIEAKEQAVQMQHEAQKQTELMQQKVNSVQASMDDWEKTKAESLKTAKEAMFSTGGELFRKEAETFSKQTTEGLQTVLQSVASLQSRVKLGENTVNTLWKSLSSPGAAGNFAEFGLENTFKRYGLEPGHDFVMQHSVAGDGYGKTLRPDAVVFLPGNHLLVVDSKASKFFLDLAEVEGTEKEEEVLQQLKRTMQEHLKSLASKGYKDAIKEYYKIAEKDRVTGHVMMVMYIQSEASIEKIYKADPEFRHKAEQYDIIVTGPTGLAGLMSFARYGVAYEQQQKNQELITSEISNLLGSIETVLGHTLKVGKGIESAANHYNKLTRSLNRGLLSKARKIHKLGIPVQGKSLPANLPTYHVVADTASTIEGEAEEVTKQSNLELEPVAE